jgi:hypothetical protein
MHFSEARTAPVDITHETLTSARVNTLGTNASLSCSMHSSIGILNAAARFGLQV